MCGALAHHDRAGALGLRVLPDYPPANRKGRHRTTKSPAHLVEFLTAEGSDRHFQAKMPYGLVVPDVKAG
jgi:hypothetical protein